MLEHFSHISGWIFSSLCDTCMHQDENRMCKLCFSLYPSKNELATQEMKCLLLFELWIHYRTKECWISQVKYEKNIAVTIPWPLAVFEYLSMEQRNKKGEILLLYCLPSTYMIGSYRFWNKAVRIQHTNSTYCAQVTSLFSTPAYTWFVPATVWLFQHYSTDATLVVDLQEVNCSALLVKEDGQSAIDACGVHMLLFIFLLPPLVFTPLR